MWGVPIFMLQVKRMIKNPFGSPCYEDNVVAVDLWSCCWQREEETQSVMDSLLPGKRQMQLDDGCKGKFAPFSLSQ